MAENLPVLPGGLPAIVVPPTPLLDRWRAKITVEIKAETELPPADTLPALRAEAAALAEPALAKLDLAAAKVLAGSWPNPPANSRIWMAGVVEELSRGGYPPAVIVEAVSEARRTLRWVPSIAEIIELCERHAAPIKALPRAIDRVDAEHRRREAVREAKAASEGRTRRLAELYGPDAPADEVFQACASALRTWGWGRRQDADRLTDQWRTALGNGEDWALSVLRLVIADVWSFQRRWPDPELATQVFALLPNKDSSA